MNRLMKLNVVLILVSWISVSASINADPGHLEPCPVGCNYYDAALFTALLKNTNPRLWMIVPVTTGYHSAVIIDERVETEEVEARVIIKSRQLFLKYVEFKKPFKRPLVKNYYDVNAHYDIDWSNDLDQFEMPIDCNFEMVIRDAWISVLADTHYSIGEDWGLASVPYVFYCDRYYGYTCTPYTGSPALLVELGDKLSLLAQSEEKDRDELKKQCLELASKITNRQKGSETTTTPKATSSGAIATDRWNAPSTGTPSTSR